MTQNAAADLAHLPALERPQPLPLDRLNPTSTPYSIPFVSAATTAADPLLSLSPEETLAALRRTELVPSTATDKHTDAIARGISNASATERALGVRAAVLGSKARAWYAELSGWRWTGSFKIARPEHQEEREGSLPPAVVAEREARIEEIQDELEALDIEELKDFVRNAHLLPNSRATSLYELDITAPSVARYLDDFTALATATILTALPYIHRVNRLLGLWSTRLLVLHQVPTFLNLLWSARTAVDSAWNAIKPDPSKPNAATDLSRDAYITIQAVLGPRVTLLAKSIDSMLDALEGHLDTLPDEWIDLMESVQADYEEWVASADRLAEEHTWRENMNVSQDRVLHQSGIQQIEETSSTPNSRAYYITGDTPTKSSASGLYKTLNIATTGTAPLLPSRSSFNEDTEYARNLARVPPPINENLPQFEIESDTQPVFSRVAQTGHASNAAESPHTRTAVRRPPGPLRVPTNERPMSIGSSPPGSATSSSFASDISEPQIMEASPIQFVPLSPTKASLPTEAFPRRDSVQTNGSTARGSLDLADSHDGHQNASSFDQSAATDVATHTRVRNILIKRHGSTSSASSKQDINEKTTEGQIQDTEADEDRADDEDEDDDDSNYGNNSFIEPLREPRTLEEQLANRIRSILTHIPTRIRFASGQYTDNLDAKSQSTATSRSITGHNFPIPPRSSGPGITLAPAFGKKATPKVSSGQSDIKVYNLHQPDREKPIKLYVRLVGDEERVMVRVGGGWADLGDYLREYALHHGRRTASDSRSLMPADLAAPGTPPRNTSSAPLIDSSPSAPPLSLSHRKIRGPIDLTIRPTPETPELARRSDALSPGEPTPSSESRRAVSGALAEEDGVGLGGTKRNLELSPTKQAWVEGMLDQATRQASGEKKAGMGELGKAGSTRRVFMKGGPGN